MKIPYLGHTFTKVQKQYILKSENTYVHFIFIKINI